MTDVKSAEGDRVYAHYVKPVEELHMGEYVIVRPSGEMIFAPDMDDLMEMTVGMDHPDNWLFKVGKITAFELL